MKPPTFRAFREPGTQKCVPGSRKTAVLVDRALPELLEGAARSLRGGSSLRGALVDAAAAAPPPLAHELSVALAPGSGTSLGAAIDAWAATRASPSVRLTAAAIGLAAETGGAPARSLDAVAATLRDRLAVAAEVRALATQARLSAVVIGVAPLAFGVVAAALDQRTLTFLFATPLGLSCLTLGVGLDALGFLWMRRITGRVG
jgi:tight adherence protein B